jgi:tetratricopeptide (TPR) repeat protein
MKKKILLSCAIITSSLIITSHSGYCQQTLSLKDYTLHFRQAKEYYDAKNYVAAKEEFIQYLQTLEPINGEQAGQKVLAEYYITMCTIYMTQPESEILAERFVANHPEHPQSIKLLRGIGSYFYDNADYAKAIKYLSRASETNLEAKYKLAISYYETKSLQNALQLFDEIKISNEEEFAFSAAYYAAVLNFQEKRYADAVNDFKKAENSSKYRAEIPNWVSMCYFHQGKFNELLNYAEPILRQKSTAYKLNELSLLVAEVQFKLGYFDKAVPNFELAQKSNPTAFNNAVKYRFGFSLYKTNQFAKASDQLKPLIANKDTLSQYAALALGLSQLKAGNLEATLDAFSVAKSLNYNKNIQEDAYFNYAKVLLDLGKASETIYQIQEFNKAFPGSKYEEEANEIVADAFINSNNLKAALDYLKGLSKRSPKLNIAFQTLSYNLAVSAYNSNKFEESIELFDNAIEIQESQNIKAQAIFGKAEALSQLKKFQEAIQIYSPLLVSVPEVENSSDFQQKVRLGLAYAYFNTKDFTKANVLFRTYADKMLASPNAKSNPNILLRLADTYLVAKNYEEALNYYTKAIDQIKTDKDYAIYQRGVTLSYLNKETEAKQAFRKIRVEYPTSKYLDDAIYQDNLISFNNNKYKDAIAGFTDLIQNKADSPYLSSALLKRAQSYGNLNQHEQAITDYKKIIADFSTDKNAKEALLGLQEELNEVGRPEEFGDLLSAFQKNSPENEENIEMAFNAAKSIYLGEKYEKALAPLKSFIEKHPENEHVTEATFLIADAAYRIGDKANALTYYGKMIEQNVHPQVNKAIQRSAEIESSNKNFAASNGFYQKLKSRNIEAKEQIAADYGIFNNYISMQSIDSASVVAETILSNPSVSNEDKFKLCKQFIELSAEKTDEEVKWLTKSLLFDKGDLAAANQLKIAQILFNQQKYKESSDLILDKFRNAYAEASENIVGKAYILLSDNFVALKNIPQAKATLKSIIDNSADTEVVELAKSKLSTLPAK